MRLGGSRRFPLGEGVEPSDAVPGGGGEVGADGAEVLRAGACLPRLGRVALSWVAELALNGRAPLPCPLGIRVIVA
jgi:hypothetical protein